MRETVYINPLLLGEEIITLEGRVRSYFNSRAPILHLGRLPEGLGVVRNEDYLGGGCYGKVYSVNDCRGNRYAVKTTINSWSERSSGAKRRNARVQIAEALILEHLQASESKFVTKFYASWNDASDPFTYLILIELMDQSLDRWMQENDITQRQQQLGHFTEQFLDGLEYLQSRGVVHADIKPPNVLLSVYGNGRINLRLADFGISILRDHDHIYCPQENSPHVRHPSYTINFRAAELNENPMELGNILSFPAPDFSHDLYATAILLISLVSDFTMMGVQAGKKIRAEMKNKEPGREYAFSRETEIVRAFEQRGGNRLLCNYSYAFDEVKQYGEKYWYFLVAQIAGWQCEIPSDVQNMLSPEHQAILSAMTWIVNVSGDGPRPTVTDCRQRIDEALSMINPSRVTWFSAERKERYVRQELVYDDCTSSCAIS